MGFVVSLLAWIGPVIGGIGFYAGVPVLFWIGVAFAGLNLFMNVASGVMSFPILPLVCVIIGGVLFEPWYFGASVGLLLWTAIEATSEILTIGRQHRTGV